MNKILIVEDDISLCEGISVALKSQNNIFFKAHNIRNSNKILLKESIDLIILDVNLPDGNGFELLKKIRKTSNVKIIMLTANDLENDIVKGLENGADDYITKPFSLNVLRARVNSQLRVNAITDLFVQGDFNFNFNKLEFYCKGKKTELSKAEYKLLKFLTDNKGITLEREKLVDRIWTDGLEYVEENALSVTVKRLRDKLGHDAPIKTVYGIGYRWE